MTLHTKSAKPIIVANWKMYVTTPKEVASFASAFKTKNKGNVLTKKADVRVAAPFTLLPTALTSFAKSGVVVGAQTLSTHSEGAHTGEVSGAMLAGLKTSFVIVGHSERRAAGEENTHVAQQIVRAQKAGLAVVLCVGETSRDDHGHYFEVVALQLVEVLRGLPKDFVTKKLVVAYEPVWAIGKTASEAMQPADVEEMQIFVRKVLTEIFGRAVASVVPILYGGSVKPENARELMSSGGVAGFLVGSASAKAPSLMQIITEVCKKS